MAQILWESCPWFAVRICSWVVISIDGGVELSIDDGSEPEDIVDDTEDADATNDHGKKSNVVNKIKEAAKPVITVEQLKKAKDCKGMGTVKGIDSWRDGHSFF